MKNYTIYYLCLICFFCCKSSFAQCGLVVGDTVYVTVTNNLANSLRTAINCVNEPASTVRYIHFNISGAGVKTITSTGTFPLPIITKNNVVIDARTQPGWYLGNIVLVSGGGNTNHALRIQASNVSIYGLTISGYTNISTGAGIFLQGNDGQFSQNAFIGNRYGIRTDFSPSFTATNNLIGVDPVTNAANGNLVAGVSISSSTGTFVINNNTIANNTIGVESTGAFATVLANRNSFYCNAVKAMERGSFSVPGFSIDNAFTRIISGSGPDGALIEVFIHNSDGCASVAAACEGRIFIGTTTVSSGSWTLNVADGIIPQNAEVTATATIGGNNTSEFLNCLIVQCPVGNISFSNIIAACANTNSGTATANVSILGSYTYDWSNGQTGNMATNLIPATYDVTATDASTCTITASVVIESLDEPTTSLFSNSPLCEGADLVLEANTLGGTPPYTYNWEGPGGFTSSDEMPIIADVALNNEGTYSLIITDQNLCESVETTVVTVNERPVFDLFPQNVLCFGENNGAVNLTPVLVAMPETYDWSNNEITQDINDLSPGTYSVTVMDANGCEAVGTTAVTEPTVLVVSNIQTTPPTALAAADGTLSFNVNGGVVPYSYSWTGPVDGNDESLAAGMITIDSLMSGDYTLLVKDANSCFITIVFSIDNFGCMFEISNNTVTNISCAGAMDGSIDITLVNAASPIIYSWNNGAMTEDINGLSPDTYALTATDAAGCQVFFSSPVTEPAALLLSNLQTIAPGSMGGNDGTMSFTINGGTAPYAYTWAGPVNGNASQATAGMVTINNLLAGNYTLMLTDANNCVLSQDFTIAAFACTMAVEDTDVTHIDCSGQTAGSINISIVNGMLPLTYSWVSDTDSGNGSGSIITNLSQGLYAVTITDQLGCLITVTLTVNIDNSNTGVLNFIQGEEELCQGETLLLSTNILDNPDIIYHWIVPNGDTINTTSANLLIENIQTDAAGDYTVFVNDGACLIDETGPFSLSVIGLAAGEQINAGEDAVICEAWFQLNAAAISSGLGTWIVPEGVEISQVNDNSTLATDLQDGDNQFIWVVSTDLCGVIGADTLNVLVTTGLEAKDDFFILQQANSQIFMDVVKNDGFPDSTAYTLTVLTQPQFGTLLTLANGFQYFELEGQRGTVTFEYEICFLDTACPNACATAIVTIEVLNLPYLPEGFSPNNDGKNDFLEILGYTFGGDISMALSITNRWGDIVYKTDNYLLETPWDGHMNNASNPLPEGTYYAWMEIEVDGEVYQTTQVVYLIK